MTGPAHIPVRWIGPTAVLAVGCFALVFASHVLAQSALFPVQSCSRRAVPGMVKVRLADGNEIATLFLPNPSASFTLWYFHGNAEDLGDIEPHLRDLQALGFAVFAFDYPGYGLSGGRPSERAIFAATRELQGYLQTTLGIPLARVVAYGRSVGSGPAVELAAHERVAGLVLESAFMSAYRVVTRWRLLPFDKFENLRKMDKVTCPVLCLHGRRDEVIPFYHGEALYAAAPGPKRKLWDDDAGHNDFPERAGERYRQALRELSVQCQAATPPSSK